MIEIETVPVGSKTFQYVKIGMNNAPLVLLKGKVGYVMCGYLNMDAAEKLGDVAVRVTGVSDLESVLGANVASVTSKAAELGVKQGQRVSEILSML